MNRLMKLVDAAARRVRTRTGKFLSDAASCRVYIALVALTCGLLAPSAWASDEPDPISVKYLDAAGNEQTTNAVVVTNSDKRVTWKAGWYVVTNEVTVTGGAECSGAVHLILADTAALTIDGVANNNAGIKVSGDGNSLAIYGQTLGTGALMVTGGGSAAGIGGGYDGNGSNITINGGTVTATGGNNAAGIGGGVASGDGGNGSNITINGGTVTATAGGKYAAGIGKGFGGSASGIYAADDVIVKAGDSAQSLEEIAHTGAQDLASSLAKRYVTAVLPVSPKVTVTVPAVEGATAVLYAFAVNGGWKTVASDKVPSNTTLRVVWTADDGKGLTGAGAANAYQWQATFVADKAEQTAPAPTVVEAGASEVTVGIDTRAKKSYFDAKDILPVWYAADAEVKVKGEGEQSWTTLVKSSATDDTVRWTPAAPDTYTLSQVGFANATIFYTLPVEVTTNGLELAGTTVAMTADGAAVEPQAEGEFAGKLIVASNSTVKVTYTATNGVYFADGTSTCEATFTADKSVNDAAAVIAGQKPAAPAKPSVMLGVVAQRYPWNGWADVNWKVTNWPNSRKNFKVEIKCGTTVVTNTISFPDGVQGEHTGSTGKNMKITAPKDFVGEAEFTIIEE